VRGRQTPHALGRGDETQKSNARRAGALQRRHRRDRAAAGREHRIEQKEVTFGGVTRNLEVVIDRLQGIVIPIQTNVADARSRHQPIDAFHHSEAGAQDGHQRQLLATHSPSHCRFERRVDGRWLDDEITRRLVRHEHRDLVHQLPKDLCRRTPIAKNRQFVLNQRMRDDAQRGERGGGVHGREATNFARMKEYQAVVLRLTRHARDDEDALTDLLNERSRGGWEPALMSQDATRLTIVFQRPSVGEQ
jgi:hypothetical protein